jgi:hypothetical protein
MAERLIINGHSRESATAWLRCQEQHISQLNQLINDGSANPSYRAEAPSLLAKAEAALAKARASFAPLFKKTEAELDAVFLGEQTVRNNGEGPLFEIFKATGYKCDGCKSTQLIKDDETLEGDFDHNAHCPNQDSPYREDFTLTDSGFFFETEDGDYVSEGFLTAYAAYTDAAAYDIDSQAAHGDYLADVAKEGGF